MIVKIANPHNQSFTGALSSYNKELFHSRAIGWLVNNNSIFQKKLLANILGLTSKDPIVEVRAFTEIAQIDILIMYKLIESDQYKFIHIENKIKASESIIKDNKITRKANKTMLSQTEYYYLRLTDEDFRVKLTDAIVSAYGQDDLKVNQSDLGLEHWNFVVLKPTNHLDIADMSSRNIWNLKDYQNPWKRMSYEELVLGNWTSDDKNCPASVQEYIDLLKLEFIPTVPNKFDAHNLSLVNVELAVQNKLNTADVSILEEMFMKLAYELGQLEPVLIPAIQKEPLRVESKFLTDTGNNGGFLVEVCYIISEFPFPQKSSSSVKEARIGFQYEHNSAASKMKFFFAAQDYDNVKDLDQIYNSSLQSFLDANKDQLVSNFSRTINELKLSESKFNGCRTKSFCNRSVVMNTIGYSSYNGLKDIFQNAMGNLNIDLTNLQPQIWEALKDKMNSFKLINEI